MFEPRSDDAAIAVYGAYGHTGRFVVEELDRRGLRAIRVGRDLQKLQETGDTERHGPPRPAKIDDEAALDAAFDGASLIINCAGTFLDTAKPIVSAALRAGIPYLDVAPEQVAVQSIFADCHHAALVAGVPILPAVAFYGGLADLLATALVTGTERIDSITVGVGLDSWHPTLGTRLTGERNTAPRMICRRGRFEQMEAKTGSWDFPAPLGRRDVVVMPLSEIITIASHLNAETIESWMNVEALRDIRDPATPPPEPSDDIGRSAQRFVLDVVVNVGGEHRRASASGRDIYQVSAPIVVEAAQRLLAGEAKFAGGVHALGEMFDVRSFLESLKRSGVEISYTTVPQPLLELGA